MDSERKEKLEYLKESIKLKDGFEQKNQGRKLDFMRLRQKLNMENLDKRDKIAEKRHKERLIIVGMRK